MTREIKTKIKAAVMIGGISYRYNIIPEQLDNIVNAVTKVFDEEFARVLCEATKMGEIFDAVGLKIVAMRKE